MSFQKNAGAVRRFAKAMKFGAWLQAISSKVTSPPFRLMQIGSAFWQSRALYVAARLDIATMLGDQELDTDGIGARVAANADATARLLRMLAAIGVFEESAPGVFRNNKLSAFLRADNPKGVRAMILMHNSEAMSRPWCPMVRNCLPTLTATPTSTRCFPKPWIASRHSPGTVLPPISTGAGLNGSLTWAAPVAPSRSLF